MPVRRKSRPWAMGIDPSLTGFGIAFWSPGTIGLTYQYSSKYKGVERLIDITNWMCKTIEGVTGYEVGEICMEGYAHGAKWNREVMGELCGCVKVSLVHLLPDPVCYPTIVAPNALKKFVTGKGNAPKDKMMLAVYKKWDFSASTNDEADAYALSRLAACMLGTDQLRTAYEETVAQGLTRWTERPKQHY